MKRKLFIGSSSEGIEIAREVKQYIEKYCGDWIECVLWNSGSIFSLNISALECLSNASRKFDYGILVATKDDLARIRFKIKRIPRDNVIFEMGMFLGSLGMSRAFMLVESNIKLPSDYNGITVPIFDKRKKDSLQKAMDIIVDGIKKTQRSYNLKPIPSTALALGYFENYIQQVANLKQEKQEEFTLSIIIPKRINNLRTSKTAYIQKNPSTEISVKGDGSRPTYYNYDGKENIFWDMPTTFSTLNNLIDIILKNGEIGLNPEKEEWIEHEVLNFKGTLEVLVEQCDACRGHIFFEYLD